MILNRDNNRTNEIARIKKIIDCINNKNEIGLKLRSEFQNKFNKQIDTIINNGGTNTDHYDFSIKCSNNEIIKCEEKSTCKNIKNLENIILPWQKSVQRFNGPGNKFTIGIKYAKHWYQKVIKEGNLKEEYNIKSNIPTEQEWLDKDAFKCGNPKSEYGKEFKKKYREKHNRSSLNGKLNSQKDYRVDVNNSFKFNEDDKKQLIKETQEKLNLIMNDKDCWLFTCGNIDNKFNFKWFSKIDSVQILDVTMTYKEGGDIYFNFKTQSEETDFKSILRFGKGTGFSNIRFDLR